MAPPELTRDAPVLDVLQPVVVGGGPVLRKELHRTARHGLQTLPGQPVHAHEPLVGKHRLHDHPGAARARDVELVRLLRHEQPLHLQIGKDPLARLEAIQALVGGRRLAADSGVEREHADRFQAVALPDLIVVEIVRRRDLHAAGPELGIDVLIGDDWNGAPRQGQFELLADQALVALIARVHRNCHVPQHGLGTGGRHHHAAAAVGQRIADLPDLSVFLLAVHLEVRHRGPQHRIPVDQALAAIDETFLVQPHEHLEDSPRHARIHREVAGLLPLGVGIGPVTGSAEPAHLPDDGRAGLLLPRPHALDELVAAEVVAGLAFGFELALDYDLRGDAGVVGAHDPVGVETAHPVVAHQRVHQRLLECMAHVQRPGDVGRRELDAVGQAIRVEARLEVAARFPHRVPAALDLVRFEAFCQRH